MSDLDLHDALRALDRPLGDDSRDLLLGDWTVHIEGLSQDLARSLDRRWGGFLGPAGSSTPRFSLRLFRSDRSGWLRIRERGERYRIESRGDPGRPLVVAYHFAVCREGESADWRVAISRDPQEPEERLIDNAVRYLVARAAAEAGGFCLHAAGVLHEGRAWLFAGPSRSGKTTAVSLCAPVTVLGDDFALVLPSGEEWVAPALPFDNAERIDHEPPRGWYPVARILRLKHAAETRVEQPPDSLGAASLLGSAAFPWALPEYSDALLEQVRRFVEGGGFAFLHFPVDADLRAELFG
jgi:hypothetical protein